MQLCKLKLANFKNYESADLTLSEGFNVFTGLNGGGKTNLVDAIHFLSLTKSAFSTNDAASIRKGADFFRIEGHFQKNEREVLVEMAYSQHTKKIIKADKALCEKVKDHVGQFPIILITPYDTDVIREGSEERRKFFDSVFSQIDQAYLSELIKYNQVLKQRNSLLKQFFENRYSDDVLIEVYDKQLLESGKKIFAYRKKYTEELLPAFYLHFEELTGRKEAIHFEYESQWSDEDFEKEFKSLLRQEIAMQRTLKGIHKDDYNFKINELPLKNYGSQGQQKSYVIALKLAQFDLLKKYTGTKPILLLDDIFDKLDDERIEKLMNMISQDSFGQVVITDAREERTLSYFDGMNSKMSIFRIEKGSVATQLR